MSCMSLEACPTGQQKQHPKPCPLEFKSTNGHTFIRTPFKWTDGDPMKTILYARVSTADQTIAHQRKQAEAAGFQIDTVVADEDVFTDEQAHAVEFLQAREAKPPEEVRLR